jgi:hypothetical protein
MEYETNSEKWTEEVTVSQTIEPDWLYVEWWDGTIERFYVESMNETDETIEPQLCEVSVGSSRRRDRMRTRTTQETYKVLNRELIKSYELEPCGFMIEYIFDVAKKMGSRTFWTIFEWRHSLGKHYEESLNDFEVVDKQMEVHGDPDLVDWPNA